MLKGVGFELLLASPPEYNGLVAEIYHDGKFVILVSQERGPGLFDVETPGAGLDETQITHLVDLYGLIATLESACQRLGDDLHPAGDGSRARGCPSVDKP